MCRLLCVLVCLAAGLHPGDPGESPSPAATSASPNIVLIIGDDQAWTDFGFMGHAHLETPGLDRLAREGRTFTQARVPSSLCCPSLASILTGRYPFEHRITGNEPPRPAGRSRDDAQYQADLRAMIDYVDQSPTLPRLLAAEGYRSFQTGKWWLGGYERGGFTAGMTHGDPARGGRHGDAGLTIGRSGMQPIFDFINADDDRPFFVWYAPFMPHTPHTPPAELFEKYEALAPTPHIARYWAMCEWFDTTCAELLNFLDASGHAENTIVVFVVDNGWIQQPDQNGYAPRSKRSPYDGGIRTPLIIRWPGHIEPRVIETAVSSIDIAPTILRACDIEPPKEMTGVNLLDDGAVAARNATFGDIYLHNAIDVHEPSANLLYRWCVQGTWKIIIPSDLASEHDIELYDIHADPFERENIAHVHPDIVRQLTEQTNRWWPGSAASEDR